MCTELFENLFKQFCCGFNIFQNLETIQMKFKIPLCATVFVFRPKLHFFGAGCSFWYLFLALFCHFFMQKFSFLRGWEVFLSKKRQIFLCKTSVFGGLGGLFGTFFSTFVIFSCKNSVFWEAGRSFWVKKDNFFNAKLQFLRGCVVFFIKKKLQFFEIF